MASYFGDTTLAFTTITREETSRCMRQCLQHEEAEEEMAGEAAPEWAGPAYRSLRMKTFSPV
jgi:hypothetical protein